MLGELLLEDLCHILQVVPIINQAIQARRVLEVDIRHLPLTTLLAIHHLSLPLGCLPVLLIPILRAIHQMHQTRRIRMFSQCMVVATSIHQLGAIALDLWWAPLEVLQHLAQQEPIRITMGQAQPLQLMPTSLLQF